MFFCCCSGRYRLQAENTQSPTRFFTSSVSFISARHALWQFFFFFNKCKYVLVQRNIERKTGNDTYHRQHLVYGITVYLLPWQQHLLEGRHSSGNFRMSVQLWPSWNAELQLGSHLENAQRCVNSFTAQLDWERWSASGNGPRWMMHLILFKNIRAGIIVFDRLRCLQVSGVSF